MLRICHGMKRGCFEDKERRVFETNKLKTKDKIKKGKKLWK